MTPLSRCSLRDALRVLRGVLRARATRGAAVLFVGTVVAGALNYLFNLVMARESFLGPVDFGTLSALTSLLSLEGVAASALMTAVGAATARVVALGDRHALSAAVRRLSIRVLAVALVPSLLLGGSSPWVARFLHLPSPVPVLLLIPIAVLALLLGVASGALQGTLAFLHLSLVLLIGAFVKLALSVALVRRGGGVSAAVLAIGFALLLAYAYSILALRSLTRPSVRESNSIPVSVGRGASLAQRVGPTFVGLLGLTLLFSLDLILAKWLLSAEDAGLYSGLSLLGRIIYFVCLPITLAMFPHAAQRAARGQSPRRVLALSGGVIAVCVLAFVAAYAAFPDWITRHSLGDAYRSAGSLLWLVGISLSGVTAATWLLYVFFAFGRTGVAVLPPLAALLQLLLILKFHASLQDVVLSSLAATAFLCVSLGLVAVRVFLAPARPAVSPVV